MNTPLLEVGRLPKVEEAEDVFPVVNESRSCSEEFVKAVAAEAGYDAGFLAGRAEAVPSKKCTLQCRNWIWISF